MTTIVKAIATALLFTGVGWVYRGADSGPSIAAVATPAEATQDPAVDLVAALLIGRDCWTANGPEGVIPGHVVATRTGADRPQYLGQVAAGQALAQIFDGADYGLTVHGFCR